MDAADAASLPTLTVDGLKELCRKYGLPVSGKKDELLERLHKLGSSEAHSTPSKGHAATRAALPFRSRLFSADMPSGAAASNPATPANTPAQDAARKKSPDPAAATDYGALSLDALREQCKAAGLPSSGRKVRGWRAPRLQSNPLPAPACRRSWSPD